MVERGRILKIERCHLFDGMPYLAEKDGEYHVLQGSMTADDVQKWYDTEKEAVEHWNIRARAIQNHEKKRMGVVRNVHKELGDMMSVIRG